MNLERYPYYTKDDFKQYSFYSEGPKGNIRKTIVYAKLSDNPVTYNLAFGDEDPHTGEINDNIVSDNEDRDIVLATVANTIIAFSAHYGNPRIYAVGSTASRTRLYQMSIARLLNEIEADFEIFGVIGDDVYPFEINVNYTAFFVRKK